MYLHLWNCLQASGSPGSDLYSAAVRSHPHLQGQDRISAQWTLGNVSASSPPAFLRARFLNLPRWSRLPQLIIYHVGKELPLGLRVPQEGHEASGRAQPCTLCSPSSSDAAWERRSLMPMMGFLHLPPFAFCPGPLQPVRGGTGLRCVDFVNS